MHCKHRTIQYSTIQYSAIWSSTVQYNATLHNTKQCDTVQYKIVHYSIAQWIHLESTYLKIEFPTNDSKIQVIHFFSVFCSHNETRFLLGWRSKNDDSSQLFPKEYAGETHWAKPAVTELHYQPETFATRGAFWCKIVMGVQVTSKT